MGSRCDRVSHAWMVVEASGKEHANSLHTLPTFVHV